MNRTLLSLLLLLPGAALAGESATAPDGSECADARASVSGVDSPAVRSPDNNTGSSDAGAASRVKSGGDVTDHLPTPSWRSYLPGMLR